MNLSRVLIVGAHPDDVEINAGGTIARLVEQGSEVWSCTLASETSLAGERKQESLDAQKELGMSYKHVLWGHGDDTRLLDQMSDVIDRLDQIVKRVRPTTVFTHFHSDTHQDHMATYQITVAAARTVPNLLLFKPTYPSGRPDVPFHPTLAMKLEQRYIEAKIRALKCFKSQEVKYGQQQWTDSTLATAVGDAWTYGGFHGWAELFQISRMVC